MTTPLIKALDEAVAYVREHPDEMTRSEVDAFYPLAERVYLLAFESGLHGALPKVPELRPQLESNDPPLPPVQFESKLNLPGDWDPLVPVGEKKFLVCAPPRWFADMSALCALAESLAASGNGKQKLSLDARAVGVYVQHPDWTKVQIAESLECNSKDLTPKRCPKLAAAIAAYKARDKPLRGSKDSDGNLEAWEDE